MRRALNENPMVQLGILAVGGVLLAILMFTTVLKKEDTSNVPRTPSAKDGGTAAAGSGTSAAPATTPAPASDSAATPAPTDSASTTPAPSPVTPVPATPSAGATSADGLLPGKGLPKKVLVAYARNQAIALLVVDPKGISDKAVEGYTKRLASRGDVEVFTVKAKNIGRYSRITEGVNVTQSPALVVIRPRDKTEDVPTATVSYGFRSAKSVEVALEDALYAGGTRETYPK